MGRYQVSTIGCPPDWAPEFPDAIPPQPGPLLDVLSETDSLFPALRAAIDHNKRAKQERADRWAVVVEPGSLGQTWRGARLCTPVAYKVTAIWWPQGWEPESPLDVPNCVWKAQGDVGQERLSYRRALATVRSLNRQCMAQASSTWYVLMAVENEPVSHTISFDAAGVETAVEVRRLHVVRPEPAGRGDCSHCPAHSFECAREDWTSLEQTIASSHSRPAAK